MHKFVALVLIALLLGPAASARSPLPLAEAPAASGALAAASSPQRSSCTRLAATAPPVGIGSCPGVRPGALVQIGPDESAAYCTLNFAFTGRTPSGTTSRYIGTAGHCALGEGVLGQGGGGERRWKAGQGPVARNSDGAVIGRVSYAVLTGDYDFALIRLNSGVKMSARMCTFGGPTGMRTDRPSSLVRLQYHGQGLVLGETVPGRTAVAAGMPHRTHVTAIGAAISGDSGSAVTSADGRAVGVLVAIGYGIGLPEGDGSSDTGVVHISRLGPLVNRAETFMGLRLTLLRAAAA